MLLLDVSTLSTLLHMEVEPFEVLARGRLKLIKGDRQALERFVEIFALRFSNE